MPLLTGRLDEREVVDMLLAALPSAALGTAGTLAQGLCSLQVHLAGSSQPVQAWSQHPLTAAVLLAPACGYELMSSCVAALNSCCSASSDGRQQQHQTSAQHQQQLGRLWARFQPFFSYILLQGSLKGGSVAGGIAGGGVTAAGADSAIWALMAPVLHAQLVRLGCVRPAVSLPVLDLLVRALGCACMASDAERCVGDGKRGTQKGRRWARGLGWC